MRSSPARKSRAKPRRVDPRLESGQPSRVTRLTSSESGLGHRGTLRCWSPVSGKPIGPCTSRADDLSRLSGEAHGEARRARGVAGAAEQAEDARDVAGGLSVVGDAAARLDRPGAGV